MGHQPEQHPVIDDIVRSVLPGSTPEPWLRQEEEAMPETTSRLLTNGVWFTLRVRIEPDAPEVNVMGVIDATGHVEVHPPTAHKTDWAEWMTEMRGRRDRMQDALVESGLAEFRQVAPGESELYAEPKLFDLVWPALKMMPVDWVLT